MDVVVATGSPFERGRAIGRAIAGPATTSIAFNRRYLAAHGLDLPTTEAILQPYLAASQDALPHLVEQIQGMADGSDIPFTDLFFANAFEEVYGIVELATPSPVPLERCTDVVRRAPGRTILGHTEQWYAGDAGEPVIVLDVPDDGAALLAPVVAGTLPLVGLNGHGAAFGAMSLSATDERVGVPRALVARDVLDARDRDDAVRRATRAGRAGGYSYLAAFAGGDACVIETTATTAAVLELETHTNHALAPSVAAAACAASPTSRSRLARAQELLPSAPATVDGVRSILADHGADGQDICVHPDPADGDEGSTILFAMVAECETRTLHVCAGHACTGVWEPYAIDRLLGAA
jgi:isopenicillin-N N-acyltransferase-like protein